MTPSAEDVAASQALLASKPDLVYLQHSYAVVRVPPREEAERDGSVALRVFGSPYSPDRGKQNWAFQYGEAEAETLWESIGKEGREVDVLITHTPPQGYCDASEHWVEGGCGALMMAVNEIRPLLHICGHCHEGRGAMVVDWAERDGDGRPDIVSNWQDPAVAHGSKKLSLLRLNKGASADGASGWQRGKRTAIVNASIMAQSYGFRGGSRSAKVVNTPMVVDLDLPVSAIDSSDNTSDARAAEW